MSESTSPTQSGVDQAEAAVPFATRRERREAEAAQLRADISDSAPVSRRELRSRAVQQPARRRHSHTNTRPRPGLHGVLSGIRRSLVAGGVMTVAAGLIVGTTIPSAALLGTAPDPATVEAAVLAAEEPDLVSQTSAPVVAAEVPTETVERDGWVIGSVATQQSAAYLAAVGGFANGFTPTYGSIRWPFPYSTPMSSGFGESRWGDSHTGLDFNPGAGSAIQSIAAGTVTWVGWDPGYSLGYYVAVEHVIFGQRVESLYAHMIDGSGAVSVGQQVAPGDELGLVGNTGLSTGPHLHLRLTVGDERVDPYAWLTAYATND